MTKLLLILPCFIVQTSFAQVDIRGNTSIETHRLTSDSVNTSPNKAFEERIKLLPIDQTEAEIDIRLYTHHALSNTKNLRRLFKEKKWKAVEYEEWNKPVRINKYHLIPQPQADSLFRRLLANDIMTLPAQDVLQKPNEKKEITEDGEVLTKKMIHVIDGYSYTIEIKIGRNYRIYRFNNPEVYAKHYTDILEFKKYASIIELFKSNLIRKSSR